MRARRVVGILTLGLSKRIIPNRVPFLRPSKRRSILIAVAVAMFSLGFGTAAPVAAQSQIAVEYYYPLWGYYFVTAFPDEIAALDAGAFGGAWQRTGQQFTVLTQGTNGAASTCRFFSTAFNPKSSHFYTPYEDECAAVKLNPGWQYEAIAFYLQLPDANGICPAGTVPLYRLYNNGMGGAPNHRYTTTASVFNQMRAANWTFEGNGLTGAFACVPPGPALPATAEGIWFQPQNADSPALYGIVLDTGRYYFLYAAVSANPPVVSGFLQGRGTSVDGTFSAPAGEDANCGAASIVPAALYGQYASRATLDATLSTFGGPVPLNLSYQSEYENPVSLATLAGTYSGIANCLKGGDLQTLTIDAGGAISGSTSGCTFTGTAHPHGGVDAMDVSITFAGTGCALNTSTLSGIAFYDAPSGTLYLAASSPQAAGFKGAAFAFAGVR
jgi:hypothetical protein